MTKRVYTQLYQMFGSRIPPKLLEDLEDAMNDGWRKIWENRNKYDTEKGTPYNWIFQIMVNSAKNVFNKQTPTPSGLLGADGTMPDDAGKILNSSGEIILRDTAEFDESDVMSTDDKLRIIEDAINHVLEQKERDIFIRRVKREMKVQDIANDMNIALGTVNYNFNKACAKIKQYLYKAQLTF